MAYLDRRLFDMTLIIPDSFKKLCTIEPRSYEACSGIDPDGNVPYYHSARNGYVATFKCGAFSVSGFGGSRVDAKQACFRQMIWDLHLWQPAFPDALRRDLAEAFQSITEGNPFVIKKAFHHVGATLSKKIEKYFNDRWCYQKIN